VLLEELLKRPVGNKCVFDPQLAGGHSALQAEQVEMRENRVVMEPRVPTRKDGIAPLPSALAV
jgi:hypothetical protein